MKKLLLFLCFVCFSCSFCVANEVKNLSSDEALKISNNERKTSGPNERTKKRT